MARLTTFYDDAFNDHLKSQKAVSKTPAENLDLATFAKRVGRMADTGAGITRIDLERYIGRNDLLRFNYLSRGLQAGKAVCRIYVADKFGGGGSWGTGFLISPSLIITNHHVIPDSDSASRAFAEFGYEADNNGLLLQGARFILQPQKTFVTSPVDALDISIIAISDLSDNGSTSIADYGFLRMNPGLNKVDEMEFVSIIEHPGADEKYIAIRENKVIKIGDEDPARDTRIWYESDTIEGASGAGVFNDQWQVVAVHHSAVAETRIDANSKTEVHLVNDEWVLKNDDNIYPAEPHYIANEGIRLVRSSLLYRLTLTMKVISKTILVC
jgi:endonuclease G